MSLLYMRIGFPENRVALFGPMLYPTQETRAMGPGRRNIVMLDYWPRIFKASFRLASEAA